MRTYICFFINSTGWNGKDFSGPVTLIPACGSDSHYRIDGRLSRWHHHELALERSHALKGVLSGIRAYQVIRGERISTARPISPITLFQ